MHRMMTMLRVRLFGVEDDSKSHMGAELSGVLPLRAEVR